MQCPTLRVKDTRSWSLKPSLKSLWNGSFNERELKDELPYLIMKIQNFVKNIEVFCLILWSLKLLENGGFWRKGFEKFLF